MSDKLTKIEPQQAIEKRIEFEPFDVRMLLEKAVDSKAAVEVVKELRAMQREDQDRRAKFDFNSAMSKFQAKCPVIKKTKSVSTNAGAKAYSYAPLELVEQVIRPLEEEFGFHHTFNQDVKSQEGWVITICTVTHVGGHSEPKESKFPLGTKTNIMSSTQQYAAALTFAFRRTLASAYGLVFADEDDDGRLGNKPKPAAPNAMEPVRPDDKTKLLATELWKILTPIRGTAKNWIEANQWMWKNDILDGGVPEEAPNLPIARLEHAILKSKELLTK